MTPYNFANAQSAGQAVRHISFRSWRAYWIQLWKWIMYGDVPASEMPSDDECRSIMAEQDATA